MKIRARLREDPQTFSTDFTESNHTFRISAETLGIIAGNGKDGTVFYPVVSDEGVISWINDGGLKNPDPVSIRGPSGSDGISPIVTINAITDGHRITISDIKGSQSFDILNGSRDNDIIAQQVLSHVYKHVYNKAEIDKKLSEKAQASALSELIQHIGIIPDSASDKTLVEYLDRRLNEIETSLNVVIPPASADSLGGVKSAIDIVIETEQGKTAIAKENAVYVDEQGEMSIKKISTDILGNGKKELILSGGSSKKLN